MGIELLLLLARGAVMGAGAEVGRRVLRKARRRRRRAAASQKD
jgi:hypothetical protein